MEKREGGAAVRSRYSAFYSKSCYRVAFRLLSFWARGISLFFEKWEQEGLQGDKSKKTISWSAETITRWWTATTTMIMWTAAIRITQRATRTTIEWQIDNQNMKRTIQGTRNIEIKNEELCRTLRIVPAPLEGVQRKGMFAIGALLGNTNYKHLMEEWFNSPMILFGSKPNTILP